MTVVLAPRTARLFRCASLSLSHLSLSLSLSSTWRWLAAERPDRARSRRFPPPRAGLAGLALTALLLGSLCASAGAAETLIGPESGGAAGQINDPEGLAFDQSTGALYISDRNNFRVDDFDSSGNFLLAFGFGVRTGARELQTCTAATGCLVGSENTLAPKSVAIDQVSHDVYVSSNDSVGEYTAAGDFVLVFGGEVNETAVAKRRKQEAKSEPVTVTREEEDLCTSSEQSAGEQCGQGQRGSGPGSFGGERTPVAVDQEGHVWVGDVGRVEEFGAAGEFLGEVKLPGAGEVQSLAIDAFGDLYVVSSEVAGVRKLEPNGTVIWTADATGNPNSLTLDPANGDLFVSDQAEPNAREGNATFLEYDSSGVEVESFGSGEIEGSPRGNALVFDEAASRLLVASRQSVQSFALPPAGPLVVSGSSLASGVSKTGATLNAVIDPEGAETTYHFQYVDQRSFETEGGFASPHTVTSAESASIGKDFAEHPVSLQIEPGKLAPGTAYRFRVVARNATVPGGVDGEAASFQALPPARIDTAAALDVASTSATLEAQIAPLGDATEYRFEYLTEAEYQADGESFSGSDSPIAVPRPDASIGSGEEDVTVSQHIQRLSPSTVYLFRVLAHNALGVEISAAKAFTTQGVGGSLVLPDDRQWELVSPPDKHGALLQPISENGVVQAAASGDGITYLGWRPTEDNPPGFPLIEQILSTRSGGVWSTQDISTPHSSPAEVTAAEGTEYKFFSEDLSFGLVEPLGKYTPLAPDGSPPDTERTEYVRRNATCPAAPADCFEPLLTGATDFADVPVGTEFGGREVPEHAGEQLDRRSLATFDSATPDLAHVIVGSSLALTSTHTEKGGLYEWSAGAAPTEKLQLVSVLPGGEPSSSSGAWPAICGARCPRMGRGCSGRRARWKPARGISTCVTSRGAKRYSSTRYSRAARTAANQPPCFSWPRATVPGRSSPTNSG